MKNANLTGSAVCLMWQVHVAAGVGTVDDASCTDRVSDVEDLGVFSVESFYNLIPQRRISFHAEAYKTIIKGKFLLLSISFHNERSEDLLSEEQC